MPRTPSSPDTNDGSGPARDDVESMIGSRPSPAQTDEQSPRMAWRLHQEVVLLAAWGRALLLQLARPLAAEERDRYCAESRRVEPLLGMPPGCLPGSVAALRDYLAHMLASGDIAVGDTARELAQDILYPPTFLIARPLVALARLPAVGLLPGAIRHGYGLDWGPRHDRALAT